MIQNPEFFNTEEQCYLLIHKNACSSIRANLREEFRERLREQESNGIRWTVTRDPYDRFVDAISYDIRKQYPKVSWENRKDIVQIIANIPLTNYIINNVPHAFTSLGTAPHSVLQSIYMFDASIDIIVDAKDLEHFIPIHFSNPVPAQNLGIEKHQDIVESILSTELLHIKDKAIDLLKIDYIMLESFRAQGRQWSWGCGKIW